MLPNNEKQNANTFEIDGMIHGKPVSAYIEEQIEISHRKPRILIAILSVLLAATFIWGAISQYGLISQKDEIQHINQYKHVVAQAQKNIQNIKLKVDSLENIVYKLRTENEILSENTEPPVGVFFEIQIGSFTDFNIDKYNQNLANLRQEKYNKKTKFLLGRFRSFKKALIFESDLKKMGIKHAFMVGRIDEKIVTYNVAIEALKQSNN